MKRRLTLSAAVLGVTTAFAGADQVPYPQGYRNWVHVKSMVIQEGHPLFASFGGIHHIYGNAKAIAGYEAGRFEDGAVIVFDLLEAQADGHALVEGPRKVLGVMHKDARRYAATGGWGFEGFAGGDPKQRVVGENAKTACFDCHASQAGHDYVFSRKRDR
ncbi:Cytochrome P460 [Fontimonas thermophila]|uniref:Cytochrome P460 n=1 Tax=Fontimonas thermophila TaxID=1076937 RepID=A0A1I2KI33_9GAMM|nr:cytochrome P460 family protein [Fontimonas thermophila]SFF64927.1 Cytochrome P460 [Fontimonas thermophila]